MCEDLQRARSRVPPVVEERQLRQEITDHSEQRGDYQRNSQSHFHHEVVLDIPHTKDEKEINGPVRQEIHHQPIVITKTELLPLDWKEELRENVPKPVERQDEQRH